MKKNVTTQCSKNLHKNNYSLIVLLLFFLLTRAIPSHALYVKRYSAIANGGMTYTGNGLGLSKRSSSNAPGTSGAIGTFMTTDTSSRDGSAWPFGTTSNWTLNSSSAQLRLPAGSTVIYAELIWGGSYLYGGQNVSANLNDPVTLITPGGSDYNVSPAGATSVTLSGENYYVRSSDITSIVKSAGQGAYTVGRVPGTEATSENNANTAGWTIAVIYGNPSLPARNMTIFVGGELTSSSATTTSTVSGFCTPQSGAINARVMVSAIEGDSNLTGDSMLFGPTVATLSTVSGPNNPATNFFASQINNDSGNLDTSGTFGTSNHTPGTNGSGKRQGWDITNVDVSSRMQHGQSTAVTRGTTSGDRYIINSLGLQINVGAPVFPTAVMTVDKTQTYVGDILTYTVMLDNTTGSADAMNVLFTDTLPRNTSFVNGSFTANGTARPSENPVLGVSLGTIAAGQKATVSYQAQVTAIPLPPGNAIYNGQASWTYQYQSCPSFPLNNGAVTTNVVTTGTARLEATKSADPPGSVLPGGIVTYTIHIANTGTGNTQGTTLIDPIPEGMTYVPSSSRLNGSPLPDEMAGMPFSVERLVNGPARPDGEIHVGDTATVSFQVTINPMPPLIITNIATVDPDGSGPMPYIQAIVTNPPVRADLAVSITDNQDRAIAGNPISYLVTIYNHGPDTVIGFNLSLPLPSEIKNPVYTASEGVYDWNTNKWTGLNLASGQFVTLTLSAILSPSAASSLSLCATLTPSPGVEDTNSANNLACDQDTILLQADLAITKTDGQEVVMPGGMLTYTITVANNGPGLVTSVNIQDTLPPLLQNPVFTPDQGVYNEETGDWTGLTLGPGHSVILTLTGQVDQSAQGRFLNTVTLAPPAGVTDPNPENNSANDLDIIGPIIKLIKSVDITTARPGDELTYSVAYKNLGGSEARTMVVMDNIPPDTDYLAGSLRIGDSSSTYMTARQVTDALDGDEGSVNGDLVYFTIHVVSGDDGIPDSGNDEGKVYFKVKVR